MFVIQAPAHAGAFDPAARHGGEQPRAALHGGALLTPQGEQMMDGVLPQKAQGTAWATMAGRYGLTTEDLLPPAGKAVVVKRAAEPLANARANAKTKAKSGAKAKPSAKGKAKATGKKAVKKTAKKKAAKN